MSKRSASPVALITGASRGIGRAIAAELSVRGYRLMLAARGLKQLDKVAASLKRSEDDIATAEADAGELSDLEHLVAGTISRFKRIDVVVHNAGYAPVLSIEQTTAAEWARVVNVNLGAAVHLARLVWPTMKQQKGGVIANISSMAAVDPFAGFAAYGAAKAGLHALGVALAREGETHNIRVHTLALGAVETQMFRNLRTPEQWPTEKCLKPQDVASVVGLCAAGDLRYSSGQVIYLRKTAT